MELGNPSNIERHSFMDKEKTIKKEKEITKSGEELLDEYFSQDKDDKHYMGYSIYTRTDTGDCCC